MLLIDLPESGTVDWDAVLGDGGFRSPFYTRAQMARRKAKASVKPGKKQLARAAA